MVDWITPFYPLSVVDLISRLSLNITSATVEYCLYTAHVHVHQEILIMPMY